MLSKHRQGEDEVASMLAGEMVGCEGVTEEGAEGEAEEVRQLAHRVEEVVLSLYRESSNQTAIPQRKLHSPIALRQPLPLMQAHLQQSLRPLPLLLHPSTLPLQQ